MHFRQSSAQNRSKGQHMQKAEMSIPRIAPVKKAVKAETVTLRHLATALAESNGLPKAKVNAMLMGMVGDITKHLKKGKRIRLNGLGILQVRKRPARMGRNPATGEAIKIKASKKIAFRASKDLKEAVM
jgi:DNA-binding protein HU-beta